MAKKKHRGDRDDVDSRSGKGSGLTPARGIAIVLGILAVVFIFENTTSTRIRVIIPVVNTPLWLALLAVGLIGVIVGWSMRSRR
ncbi:hypothetical protein ACFQLX_25390 [Streptomyces polyrhachis]|uniref:DUF1049 domain-containing protein n=1 Tax=Streptomyces polyrhachis TaxID=1282885 RepID=A0ABW2GL74_9ACTN